MCHDHDSRPPAPPRSGDVAERGTLTLTAADGTEFSAAYAAPATARALGLPVRQYKQVAVWIAEKGSRLKLNGHLLSRSPLSSLVEFEFLASAVRGKRSGFETLRIAGEVDSRIDNALFDRLIDQANRQFEWATDVRREVAAEVFGGDPAAVADADTDA